MRHSGDNSNPSPNRSPLSTIRAATRDCPYTSGLHFALRTSHIVFIIA